MGRATMVVPELQYVLEKLSMKKPLFTYEASEYREVGTDVSVRGVTVMCDAEVVGNIEHRIDGGRRSSGDGSVPDAFFIESVHIKKERGRRNTIITSDGDKAVKLAIKHFAPMKDGDVCDKMIRQVIDRLDTVAYRSRTSLSDVVSYTGEEMMRYVIERHMFGEDIPLPSSVVLNKDKLHLYDTYLAGKQIVKEYNSDRQNRKGFAIWALPDNSVRVLSVKYKLGRAYEENVANGAELKRYRSFDDLPIDMQSKVAVLKIAQKDDPIMDIGVKLQDEPLVVYTIE